MKLFIHPIYGFMLGFVGFMIFSLIIMASAPHPVEENAKILAIHILLSCAFGFMIAYECHINRKAQVTAKLLLEDSIVIQILHEALEEEVEKLHKKVRRNSF